MGQRFGIIAGAGRFVCVLGLLALAACGGGGGSTGSGSGGSSGSGTGGQSTTGNTQQVFAPTPGTLAATFTAGEPPSLTVTLTPTPTFTVQLYVSVSPAGVMQPSPSIALNSSQTYTVTMQPLATLAPSHLTGTLSVSLCYDAACTKPAPGSPVSLPYDLTIVAPPPAVTLSPSTLTGSFVAGSPFPFNITVQATPAASLANQTLYASVNDPTGTFASTALLGYLDPNQAHELLQVTANSSLAPGTYTGTLELSVCSDSACRSPVIGSPVSVPFDVTIGAAPANSGLTPLTPWPGVSGWGTYQGNASHTGYVPVTLDSSVFAPRWTWSTPNGASNAAALSTISVSGGQLYVDSGNVLYALAEYDHTLLWSHDFSNITVDQIVAALNPPAVNGGSVYVATSAQTATYMFGLSASDGTVAFQSQMQAQWEHYLAPTIANGAVYTDGGEYGGMYAFNATTGAQNFFAYEDQYDEWTPAVDVNYAYAYTGGVLRWVNATTGAAVGSIADPTWQWSGYSIHGAPVLGAANSVLVVNVGNTTQNSLVDFNISTSSVSWSAGGSYAGNPAYANGTFYAINESPMQLEARSEATGALQWSWSPPTAAETSYVGDVLVTNNLVFLSTNTTIYAIDTTTHQSVWSVPTSGYLALSENGVLYIVQEASPGATGTSTGTTGRIYAFNVK